MKSSKFWIAVVVAGVVMNIVDFLCQGMMFTKMYYEKLPDLFITTGNPVYYIVGDFVSVLVLAWVYDKVYSSFGGGSKGGMMFGLYAGILASFPTWIFAHLMFKGFPYGLSWAWTIYGVLWGVIAGTVVGAMYKKGEMTAS